VSRNVHADHRPPLRIAQQTWDHTDAEGRQRLVYEADSIGLRLVIVRLDGDEWSPASDPAEW
jgi:hypothetical protein